MACWGIEAAAREANELMTPFLMLLLAGLLAALLVGLQLAFADRLGFLDHPGQRSSHASTTPTGAGLGMVLALILVTCLPVLRAELPPAWWSPLLGSMLVLSVLGWFDDRHTIAARWRLLLQVVVAVATWVVLAGESSLVTALAPGPRVLLSVLAVLFLVWSINAFNFMDGSNGLAGTEAVFAAACFAGLFAGAGQGGLALLALLMAAVTVGFLPWNLPRGRIFMGDAGSLPMGYALASFALIGVLQGYFHPAIALLPLAIFHVDAGLTLVQRMFRGEQWYNAHNEHVYQRLITQGWSHVSVLLLYQALNVVIVAPAILLGTDLTQGAWLLAIVVYAMLAMAWALASVRLRKRA